VIVLLFVPSAKLCYCGLMKTGLFQPEVSSSTSKPIQVKDIGFRDAKGKTVTLSALKGKVVFINFWATWCPPCMAEMPSINTLYQKLGTIKTLYF
jgi:thiol-disulfide isomerase/thioredoxin